MMAEFFAYDDEYGYAGKCYYTDVVRAVHGGTDAGVALYYTNKNGRVSSVFSYDSEYIIHFLKNSYAAPGSSTSTYS
jgi:hypothetical protein